MQEEEGGGQAKIYAAHIAEIERLVGRLMMTWGAVEQAVLATIKEHLLLMRVRGGRLAYREIRDASLEDAPQIICRIDRLYMRRYEPDKKFELRLKYLWKLTKAIDDGEKTGKLKEINRARQKLKSIKEMRDSIAHGASIPMLSESFFGINVTNAEWIETTAGRKPRPICKRYSAQDIRLAVDELDVIRRTIEGLLNEFDVDREPIPLPLPPQ